MGGGLVQWGHSRGTRGRPLPRLEERNGGLQSSLEGLGPWSAIPLRDCNSLAVTKHAREHSSSPSSPRDGAGVLSGRDFGHYVTRPENLHLGFFRGPRVLSPESAEGDCSAFSLSPRTKASTLGFAQHSPAHTRCLV